MTKHLDILSLGICLRQTIDLNLTARGKKRFIIIIILINSIISVRMKHFIFLTRFPSFIQFLFN